MLDVHPPRVSWYRTRSWWRLAWPALALLFYALLTLWLLWPYPLRADRVVMHRGDPIHQLWTMRWTQHALAHDPARLFAANVNYPYDAALALNQPTYTNALLTAPVYALTGNQVLTYNAGVLASFVLAGAFTALLVQHLTGSPWAALVAGVLYAFAPVRQAHIYHLNLLSGYWTPLVLWGLHRLWHEEGKRQKVEGKKLLPSTFCLLPLIGLALAAQILAEFYHAVYLALALVIVLLWQILVRRWGLSWRGTALLAAGGLLGLLLALPVLLPTARAWSALDLRRPAADHDAHGARLENYLVSDRPMRLSGPLWRFNHQSATSGAAEHSLYPGMFTLPLAVAGLLWARRRGYGEAPVYVAITLAAFVLSLGPTIRVDEGPDGLPSPLYRWLYDYAPGFQGARIPSRWGMLVQLALAVLAGYGVAALVALRRARWWAPLAGAALLALLALDFWGPPIGGTDEIVGEPLPEVYRALAQQPPGPVLEYPLVNADEMLPYRYEYYSTFHWRPLVNSGSSIVPTAYIELRDVLSGFPDPRAVALLQALGVRYVVVHRYEMSGWEGWWQRARATEGVRVLAQMADREDVLLAIEPAEARPPLVAERWVDASGEARALLEAAGPLVLDREHVYERWRRLPVMLEYADGRLVASEALLPTYLLGGVIGMAWPELPADVAAVRVAAGGSELRIPISGTSAPERAVDGPQITGRPLPAQVAAGAVLPCRLYGKGPVPIAGLVLSLNLLDEGGQARAKQDRFFDEGFAPPDRWPAQGGEPVPCDMPIPDDLPPGRYTFAVGLYDPAGARFVPFADPAGNVGAYWEREITVTQ